MSRSGGCVAQLERALISERTKAALKASRARVKVGGKSGLRAGDLRAIRKDAAERDRAYGFTPD
jgi:DNA invertase Pin-like site-specific DNA recombinase